MNSNFLKLWMQAAQKSVAIVFMTSLVLAGCGGGSASTTSTENNLPSPVAGKIDGEELVPAPVGQNPVSPSTLELLPQVSVGQRQFADPNVLISIRGTVVAAAGSEIVKTLWTQVTGPQVIIPSPLELENVVLMPDVNIATQLEFRLTAEDSEGRVNSATVAILIKPVPTFVKVVGGVFNETDENAVFTLRLNAPSTLPLTISYITQDGTATSEGDYEFTSGEITLAAGEVIAEIPVPLLNDIVEEGDESFSLQVTAIDGQVSRANTGVAIIRNGTEPQLQQTIQFENAAPVLIYLTSEYRNSIVTREGPQGTGDVEYMSSNPLVATVDNGGNIVPVSLGTTTITAVKFADDIYLPAETSYELRVIMKGSAPVVSFSQSSAINQDGTSVRMGQTTRFVGLAQDAEDGSLPTAAQVSSSQATGLPITSLTWTSNLDGFLGNGSGFSTTTLSMGTHVITYSATDSDGNVGSASIRVLVGNVAPLASATASSTYCPVNGAGCYAATRTNDSVLNTSLPDVYSWLNNNTLPLPQWVMLSWPSPVTISNVDLYTPVGSLIRDYDIEYLNGTAWTLVVSVKDNAVEFRTHPISMITTSSLRVMAREGSLLQPQQARISEIVVFGTGGLQPVAVR